MTVLLEKHRFTVEDYMRMADAGVFNGSRVELIDGEVYSMPPQGDLHSVAICRLFDQLRRIFPSPWFLRSQGTHRFSAHLALEPDFAVLTKEAVAGAVVDELPQLVVEISDSTIDYDFEAKRLLYAQHSVPEYWLLDVNLNVLQVFRQPNPLARHVADAYGFHATLGEADQVSPLAAPQDVIALKSILPLRRG